jgi:hypothetical protein
VLHLLLGEHQGSRAAALSGAASLAGQRSALRGLRSQSAAVGVQVRHYLLSRNPQGLSVLISFRARPKPCG